MEVVATIGINHTLNKKMQPREMVKKIGLLCHKS